MSDINRRQMLALMAAVPLTTALDGRPTVLGRAAEAAQRAVVEQEKTGVAFAPRFFSPHEWRTVRLLADLVIPRDERSGSATDAGVPEFMDFTLVDRPELQTPMRGGLRWLDEESRRRFGQSFAGAKQAQRTAILDDIAWPERARPEMSQGVAFFNRFRDLTATGFYTSRIGIEDIRFLGNQVVPEWKGCPEPALRKLGVHYEEIGDG